MFISPTFCLLLCAYRIKKPSLNNLSFKMITNTMNFNFLLCLMFPIKKLKKKIIFCLYFCTVEHIPVFPSPSPALFFSLSFLLFPPCFFAALFLYYCSRMSGNPADPNVPCLQLFKQHYVFWWQVCQSSALQSSRWVPEYLQNWRLLSMQVL